MKSDARPLCGLSGNDLPDRLKRSIYFFLTASTIVGQILPFQRFQLRRCPQPNGVVVDGHPLMPLAVYLYQLRNQDHTDFDGLGDLHGILGDLGMVDLDKARCERLGIVYLPPDTLEAAERTKVRGLDLSPSSPWGRAILELPLKFLQFLFQYSYPLVNGVRGQVDEYGDLIGGGPIHFQQSKNLYSQPRFTVWPGLFPPCRVKFS